MFSPISIRPAQTALDRAAPCLTALTSQTGTEDSAGLPECTAKTHSWEEMEEKLLHIFKGKGDFQEVPKAPELHEVSPGCLRPAAPQQWGREEPAATQQ